DPGEIWSFTAHHTVTAADMTGADGGLITNTATASSAQTGPVSASASVIVAPPGPHTTVTMTATLADGGAAADNAGGVINYGITMFNDSAIDLTTPLVAEQFTNNFATPVESGGFNVGDTNQDGILSPGESWQFTQSYTITQADIDNRNGGGIPTVDPALAHTLAVFSLYDQGGLDPASATTPIAQNPHVTLSKTAALVG